LVRIRQRVPRDTIANAHVVELAASGAQTRFDVAQTFAVSKLRKGHTQELIPAGKALEFVIAFVAVDATTEFLRRKKVHQLRKNHLARVHVRPPDAKSRQDAGETGKISNRFWFRLR
jgi:hypothetical protein